MQKKIASILFSTRLMAVLFIVFAVALGLGTFIEEWYTTATAKVLIYNARWFEVVMALFVVNFCGNIVRYRLHKREKWSSLVLHLSFILILVGAFVTRYISYEGIMPIREGATENTMLSEKTYLSAFIDGEINGQPLRRTMEEAVLLAPGVNNKHSFSTDYDGQDIDIEIVEFIHGAEEGLIEDPDGENYLQIVETSGNGRHEHYIKEGEVTNLHNVLFALNEPTQGAINITYEQGRYTIDTPFEGTYMRMADQYQGDVAADTTQTLMLRSLYNIGGMQFVIPEPVVRGHFDIIPTEDKLPTHQDAAVVRVTTDGESETVKLMGAKGVINDPAHLQLGGLDIYLQYGSKSIELPFSIRLNDFIAERYPGTENSYSSFMSKVTVFEENDSWDYDIYMNHVLDLQGYRFFQASFDPDELGTVLSVNHDWWGTWITYTGYTFLYIGLIWILFAKRSRFGELGIMLKKVKKKKAKLSAVLIGLMMSFGTTAQEVPAASGQEVQEVEAYSSATQQVEEPQAKDPDEVSEEVSAARAEAQENFDTQTEGNHEHTNPSVFNIPKQRMDSIIMQNVVTKEHASKFGKLVVQDWGGRMKPLNTYSSEMLRKLSKSATYEGLTSDQVLISMLENPVIWYSVPIIQLKRGNDSIRHVAGVSEDQKFVALTNFFDMEGNYKLAPYLEKAYLSAIPSQFDKDFIETDRRVNLLYNALQGELVRIFPIPEDDNNKWISYPEAAESSLTGMDSVYVAQILPMYMTSLRKAKETGDYLQAEQLLSSIKSYQERFGAEVIPSDNKLNAEVLYNKYDVFNNLYTWYMLVGSLMLVFVIVQIFRDSKIIRGLITASFVITWGLFVLHTIGLIARWYISGHAPMSDAYESMIYVAWATMLFGLVFGRKSDLTVAATAFITSMILMVAHWNWMDPSIANLEPVLDSYWLMIHVSVIVASYGPFAIGLILGIVSLLLMTFTTTRNKKRMDLTIREITIITEMSLTIGLVLLTIGNFLGGQWANESWGRYWGWDPKETWALVSIMVYGFVIHMRLIPGIRNRWAFNFMSVVAFASILMTYFGVNFYLSGLHSYASGDKVITPTFVYYSLAIVAVLGSVSYWRFKVHYKKGNRGRTDLDKMDRTNNNKKLS